MKRAPVKFISKNALFIFVLMSLYYIFDGPCRNGCHTVGHTTLEIWQIPIYNGVDRFLYALPTTLIVLLAVSILDYFMKPKTRAILTGTIASLLITFSIYSINKSSEMEGLAIAAVFFFAVGVLIPLTILNIIEIRK